MNIQHVTEPVTAAGSNGLAWKFGAAGLGFLVSFIAPVQPFLIAVLVLVMFDFITGIWASVKNDVPITAARASRSFAKALLYPTAILLAQLMVFTFFSGTAIVSSLTYVVALFLCSIEFQSNMENIGRIANINIWKHVKGKALEMLKGHKP